MKCQGYFFPYSNASFQFIRQLQGSRKFVSIGRLAFQIESKLAQPNEILIIADKWWKN